MIGIEDAITSTTLFSGLLPLFREINDLKRVHAAGLPGTVAGRGFARAWAALVAGHEPGRVARIEAAIAVTSARLGAIDATVLARVGLSRDEAHAVLAAAVDAVTGGIEGRWIAEVRVALDEVPTYLGGDSEPDNLPGWVGRLADQPRAGATRPGHARLILEPAESHAEHCHVTAIYAALLAMATGADPAVPFLAGLSHHLHNAALPDSGFSGEELLGEHLGPIMTRLTDEALDQLPATLGDVVREARGVLPHADTPEARAFHAADVLDRVLQMDQYARVASFELRQALGDLDLVHPGPLQRFHLDVLAGAGLWP